MTIAVDMGRKPTKTNKQTCIASLTEVGGAENAQSKDFSNSSLLWYQNVPHVITKKNAYSHLVQRSAARYVLNDYGTTSKCN